MSFEVPEHIKPLRARVRQFIEERIYPLEAELDSGGDGARVVMRRLMDEAKAAGLWALGHPKEIGGQGLPFLDYVYVNEVVGRSEHAMIALGTHSLQDSIMLNLHASPEWREKYLAPLVAGEVFPSFAMTEPEVASSDPTQLQTSAVLDGDHWVISGRKWFTTGANVAAYTTVMARTEPEAPPHAAFSMIVVPTDTPGHTVLYNHWTFNMPSDHAETELKNVRVPDSAILHKEGEGLMVAQRFVHENRIRQAAASAGAARYCIGEAAKYARERIAFGEPLSKKHWSP